LGKNYAVEVPIALSFNLVGNPREHSLDLRETCQLA
jgi:hypothetical protein